MDTIYDEHMDSQFLSNFKRRACIYNVKNPDITELTLNEGQLLTARKPISEKEYEGLESSEIYGNIRKMFENLMANSSNTWKALHYLENLKKIMPGFDHRVHHNKDGLPDGICWMTNLTRNNLLQCVHAVRGMSDRHFSIVLDMIWCVQPKKGVLIVEIQRVIIISYVVVNAHF